ncbi:MAG: glycosyltransferase [Acidimicrobiia bacterium]
MPPAPLVRAVVVNYEGGDLTLACLRGLRATEWPTDRLDVVLVDNASRDGVADAVERELPEVRVIRGTKNLGFAGGCNLGLADLGGTAYVAFVNNDATVDPGWLRPLVDALEADPSLGAACPKILLAGRFRDLSLRSPTVRHDGRDVGVMVSGVRVDGVEVWSRTQLVEGFWGLEPDGSGQWTTASARLWLPEGNEAALQLSAVRPVNATASCGPDLIELSIGRTPMWHTIPLAGPVVDVINNVGSVLTDDKHGADRGYLEPDDGRFDTPEDVFAWCGAAVVLRRDYVDDVGPMDQRLFVYYEDLEHSWRGRARGWRYRYVPASIVHHVHAATTVEGSPLKLHYEERNRLLVLTRHAASRDAWRAVLRHPLITGSYARRDIVRRIMRARRPRGALVGRRLRAFGAFLVRAPAMLRSRRRDRKQPTRS